MVDAGEGVHFGRLVSALCPDLDVADRALAKLLSNAAILRDQLAWNPIERHLTEWDPLITAIVAAATNGHTPTELTNTLDELGASTNWTNLIIALRQVLAGARDRAQLLTLTGLDVIDTAILTTVLDRLPTSSGQQQHR